MGHRVRFERSTPELPALHAEGVRFNSRWQRPRFTIKKIPDPERVAPLAPSCDPFRVTDQLSLSSGGVAPGYYIGRFQRPNVEPHSLEIKNHVDGLFLRVGLYLHFYFCARAGPL